MILFYGLTTFVIDFIYVVNSSLPYLTELLDTNDDYYGYFVILLS
jgi:hypothetical protein